MKPRQPALYEQGAKSGGDECYTRAQDEDTLSPSAGLSGGFFVSAFTYKERKITYGKTFLYLGVCHRGTPRQDL